MPDERIELLLVHKSTNGLQEEQIEVLAQHAEVIRCHEGDVIHRLEDVIDALFLIVTGRLKISAVLPGGVERTIQYLGRDDEFGLLALTGEEPYPIRVTAEQKATLLRIPKDAAERLVRELPLWGRNLFRAVGPRLLETLLNEKPRMRRRVVVLIHVSDNSRPLTSDLLQRLSQLGERVGLIGDHQPMHGAAAAKTDSLRDSAGRPRTPEEIRSILAGWSELDRLVLDASIKTIAGHLPILIDACEAVYWICSGETVDRVTTALTPLIQSSPARKDKSLVIHILEGDKLVAPVTAALEPLCQQDFKIHCSDRPDSPVCSRQAGIERVIHHLRGVSVGLALGGGAARGMAHLGVLQVLEEAGIVIDRMSGASAGALTGVLYAAGYAGGFQVDAFARDLNPPWYYRLLPYGDGWFVLGKYRLGGWDAMLRKYLHKWRLEQLAIPFSSVTVDLVLARQLVRETGDATQAILESINLPILSRPICGDGMTLVDGGVLNVVPADVLVSQNANVVIASDVAAKIRFEFAGNRPDTPTAKMKIPSSAQTATRVRTVQDRNIRSMGGSAADIVIEPDVSQVLLTDFKRARKIAQLGRTAAEAAMPEIRRILNQVDPQLFPSGNEAGEGEKQRRLRRNPKRR